MRYQGLDASIDTTPMFGGSCQHGAVYRVHCRTFKVAERLAGYGKGNVAMRIDLGAAIANPDTAPPLFSFRALKPYRSAGARELRKAVADEMRRYRQQRR